MDLKSCTIRRIMFPKITDDSGAPVFTIAEFWHPEITGAGTFTGKGSIVNPREGLTVTLTNGTWKKHTYLGKTSQQFNFEFGKVEAPTDVAGIYRYLVKHAKFVGPGIGQRLVDKYGEKTLDELRNNPARVAFEIKGLTRERAVTISEELKQNEENEQAMVELEGLLGDIAGLPKSLIPAMIREYGPAAADAIRENPYRLTMFAGVGFTLADRVAIEKLEIAKDSMYRKQAAVRHVLSEIMQSGHVWAQRVQVIEDCLGLIGFNVEDAVTKMIEALALSERGEHVTTISAAVNERWIASVVRALLSGTSAEFVTCLECFGAGCDACGGLGKVDAAAVEIEEVI